MVYSQGDPFKGDYTYLMFRHDLGVLTRHKHASIRHGQLAYNTLHDIKPELALAINGTEHDPFYMDERLDDFFVYVETHWDSEIDRRW